MADGMTPYRIAIVGSRRYPHMDLVRACIARLNGYFLGELVVISGTEPTPDNLDYQVDAAAIHYARFLGLQTVVHAADWDNLNKGAGPARNTIIVKDCDGLVAFWDLVSKGTGDVVEKALRAGKLRKVYGAVGNEVDPSRVKEALERCQRTRAH